MYGQGAGGAEHTGRDLCHRACGIDQRGGLADDAARGQNDAGQNAGHGGRQHNREHRAQLARAQTKAALAVRVGHCDQRLLRRAHDDGQNHDGQRERTGDHRIAPVQLGDEEQHTEQAVDDGRDALQRLGGDAHGLDQLAAAVGVLDQPDGRKDAQRRRDRQREGRHQHRVDERGRQRDVLGVILPGEQLGLQIGDAHDQNVADEEHQHRGGQQGGNAHKPAQRGGLHTGGAAVAAAGGQELMRFCVGHIGGCLRCGTLRHSPYPLSQG